MSYELNTKNGATGDDGAASSSETLGLVSLEPRILLDAAGFVTGADVAAEAMAVEGADFGVQAIFDDGEETSATPTSGPWLGEITLSDSGGDTEATPTSGPWL